MQQRVGLARELRGREHVDGKDLVREQDRERVDLGAREARLEVGALEAARQAFEIERCLGIREADQQQVGSHREPHDACSNTD